MTDKEALPRATRLVDGVPTGMRQANTLFMGHDPLLGPQSTITIPTSKPVTGSSNPVSPISPVSVAEEAKASLALTHRIASSFSFSMEIQGVRFVKCALMGSSFGRSDVPVYVPASYAQDIRNMMWEEKCRQCNNGVGCMN